MYEQIAQNRRKTIMLMFAFVLFIIALGWVLGLYFENILILPIAILVSIVMSWWSYFNGDKTILALSGAKAPDLENNLEHRKLVHLVENLSITAGLKQPKIYIINDPSPNAFATGRDPNHASVAVTSGLIKLLDKAELEGVIAHELSHIKNYDILLATIVITLLGVVVLISDWALRSRLGYNNKNSKNYVIVLIALILAIVSPLIARLIYLTISRKREYLADAQGALLTRYPEGLANALQKLKDNPHRLKRANRATSALYITNPFKQIKISSIFSTHPPIEKRIEVLNNMNL